MRSFPRRPPGRQEPVSAGPLHPPATITPCPNGPLLVRGDVLLTAPDGTVLPRTRGTLALCRCGRSGLAPLCDGSHKATRFRSLDPDPGSAQPGRPVAHPPGSPDVPQAPDDPQDPPADPDQPLNPA